MNSCPQCGSTQIEFVRGRYGKCLNKECATYNIPLPKGRFYGLHGKQPDPVSTGNFTGVSGGYKAVKHLKSQD